ncbi:BppU family phage baseplate upper protein, partial [Enterococcus raffinosus]
MFKTSEEIIVIQAEATTAIPTGVVFWSHDKGTAKMLFQLQKDYVNQTLSEGTIVPICLDFVGGRHIYHAIIEDAINGIVSIVLEDNILGYVGRVTGSIYIELPDSRSLDTAGRFTFDIKRSPIDLNTPELEDYYWQGFNEIIDEYHQTINTIKSEAKALIDSITADVTTAQSKITQLEQSITTANTNLNARIDEINKKIDDNDVFTKAESSANVIDQIIGKEKGQISIITDFKNKVTNSNVENPHWAGAAFV